MKNLKKTDVAFSLLVLKKGREQMLGDVLNVDPTLFRIFFEYETQMENLNLAFENYFLKWIDSHWKIFDKLCCDFSSKDVSILHQIFSEVFIKLLKIYDFSIKESGNANLLHNLVNEKISTIELLISKSMEIEQKIEQRKFEFEKLQRLFEREVTNLKQK